MELQKLEEKIFEKPLSFTELFTASFFVLKAYYREIFLAFFVYFIPVLVLESLTFRSSLHLNFSVFPNEIQGEFIFFVLTDAFFQELFSAGLILFIIAFFEKKICFAPLFLKVLFQKSLFFLITFAFMISWIVAGLFAFIVPGLLAAVFLSFGLYLVFSENLWGMQGLAESFRTVKTFWIRTFLYFLLFTLIKLALALLTALIFQKVTLPWPEAEFLLSNLTLYFLTLFFSLGYGVLFFNLRHQMKPKDQNQLPVSE